MRQLLIIPVLAMGIVSVAQQQPSSDPYAPPPPPPKPPSTQPDKNCSAQATKGSSGPWKAASTCPPPAQKDDASSIAPAQTSSQQPAKKSTEDDNPFPEDVSEKAAAAAKAKEAEDAKPSAPVTPNAGESSSSDQTKGMDLEGENDSRVSSGAGGTVLDPQLAAHDVRVGQFYLNQGDLKGAYERFREAVQVDPGNADAIFYTAEAARRLNHKDEAEQNYQLYLDALPDGPKAKDARKALQELKASAKR